MASAAAAPPLTDRQIVDRYVDGLHETYATTEQRPARPTRRAGRPVRMVAAWNGKSPLAEKDFYEVDCREITADGISFWVKRSPTEPFYVVKFALENETIYVKARVTQTKVDPTADDGAYVVESKFAGRVDL